jgi:hypothetical protein
MSSGLPEAARARVSARTAGKAPSIEAASTGQESISTTSCARACMNPVVWPALHVACVKCRATAPGAMRIGEVRNLVRQAGPPQGAGDKIAFPSRIGIRRKRLHRAAAAVREIAAERRDPMRTWGQNLDQCTPRTIDFGDDCFTGQSKGNNDRAIRALRDALAARSELVDGEPRQHCENWLPVVGRNRATACGKPADFA